MRGDGRDGRHACGAMLGSTRTSRFETHRIARGIVRAALRAATVVDFLTPIAALVLVDGSERSHRQQFCDFCEGLYLVSGCVCCRVRGRPGGAARLRGSAVRGVPHAPDALRRGRGAPPGAEARGAADPQADLFANPTITIANTQRPEAENHITRLATRGGVGDKKKKPTGEAAGGGRRGGAAGAEGGWWYKTEKTGRGTGQPAAHSAQCTHKNENTLDDNRRSKHTRVEGGIPKQQHTNTPHAHTHISAPTVIDTLLNIF